MNKILNKYNRRHFLKFAGTSSIALTSAATAPAIAAQTIPLYKNKSAAVTTRVNDLLSRMTIEEKAAQMQCIWFFKPKVQTPSGDFDAAKASKEYPHGMGMIARPSDRQGVTIGTGAGNNGAVPNRTASETVKYVNQAQKWAVENTRLGIPMLTHEEALHGFVARDATSFPQSIGLASSFDTEMVEKIFSFAAKEMRARGAFQALAPVVDIARDPRWGRIEETYGEDTHVCAEIGKAAVIGFQGKTFPLPKDKVLVTLKHMTGHGQPENGTNVGPAEITERTLRESFFPPFERLIKETNAASVMPSYNEIGGIPSHANAWLLRNVLRNEWGFKGITTSDYFAIKELISRHKLVSNERDAAKRAILAGVDVETADPETYFHIPDLVKKGEVPIALIDAAVRRILSLKFESGLFDNPFANEEEAEKLTATPEAVAYARYAAGRSVVLLKNKGVLPLNPKTVGKLLVLGTHAVDTPIGGYSDIPKKVVSILEGLQEEGKREGFKVEYSEAVRITTERIWGRDEVDFVDPAINAKLIAEAVEKAKTADTIVMVLGDNEKTSREAWADNHLGDRDSLDLLGQQNDLAREIFALGKPTIVFLLNGRPLSINLLQEKADAIIEGWYMGQETGNAAADVLFGRVNPGGKLPVSIAKSVGQLPIFYNHKPTSRRGYLAGDTKPLYPFGFGLSYTTFDISAPVLSKAKIGISDTTNVSVTVKNTGKVEGDEVVQIYIRDDFSSVTRPVKELKHFKRITLKAGESKTVTFTIKPSDLWMFNTQMKRVVEPGTFTIMAGPNSVDLKNTVLTVA